MLILVIHVPWCLTRFLRQRELNARLTHRRGNEWARGEKRMGWMDRWMDREMRKWAGWLTDGWKDERRGSQDTTESVILCKGFWAEGKTELRKIWVWPWPIRTERRMDQDGGSPDHLPLHPNLFCVPAAAPEPGLCHDSCLLTCNSLPMWLFPPLTSELVGSRALLL